MIYSLEEVANLLANRVSQPHYVRAMIRKVMNAGLEELKGDVSQICACIDPDALTNANHNTEQAYKLGKLQGINDCLELISARISLQRPDDVDSLEFQRDQLLEALQALIPLTKPVRSNAVALSKAHQAISATVKVEPK